MAGLPSAARSIASRVNAPDSPVWFDKKLHGDGLHFGRRRMFRRGRSTSRPSNTLARGDISVATCCRKPALSRKALRLDAADDPLSLADELVQLLAAADVQLPEPLEELGQVLHGRVAEDFRLAILLARQPLGQVGHQLGQFGGERLLGQPDRLVETALHPLAFLFVELRVELLKVVGRFHAGEVELDGEQASQATRDSRPAL